MDARKALSTIGRVNQRFGMGYVVEVLRGANNQRIRDMGHDKLPVYGIGKDQSHEHWVSIIRQLIHLGFATQNIAQHSALQLTEAARPVLRGEVELKLAVPRVVALKPRVMQNPTAVTTTASCSPSCVSCVKLLPMKRTSRHTWCSTTRR